MSRQFVKHELGSRKVPKSGFRMNDLSLDLNLISKKFWYIKFGHQKKALWELSTNKHLPGQF